MIKKYKRGLIYAVASIIVLVALTIMIDQSIASSTFSSESDLLDVKADSLIGRQIAFSPLYNRLSSKGNLACFYHSEGGPNGVNVSIHSAYDLDFDTEKGEMRAYSVMGNGKNKERVTTYVSDKNGHIVGSLAANANRDKNAYKIWTVLKQAIKQNVVVNEKAIIGGDDAWGGNEQFGGSGNESMKKLSNPASTLEIAEYQNYRKIKKEDVVNKDKQTVNAKETGKEVTINNKAYTVMGPFKMTFGGKEITSINVGNASWSKDKTGEIYWNLSSTLNDTNSWTSNFNQKTSDNSVTFKLSNRAFYLAVETSKLPDNGTYKVTVKQAEFQYKRSKIVVTVGSYAQQMGMYCYANTPEKVNGSTEWTITRNALKTLVINKKDSKTEKELNGAVFKIYAELSDGSKGWVSGSAEGAKTYGKQATEYAAKVEIKNLKVGVYHIYETKAPNGYMLVNQEGYHKEGPGSSDLTGDWVYVGKRTLTKSDSKVQVAIANEMSPGISIIKKDNINNMELTGAKFKLYAILDDGSNGWVSGEANASKTFGDTADEYDAKVTIEQLKFGKYYIYETKSPEGYDITSQDGYKKETEGSSALTGDWAFLGTITLNSNVPENGIFEFEAYNKKIVSGGIEGDVWVDEPDTKANATDNIYNSESKDYLKEGITVNLYDAKGNQLATTKTDAQGHYKFTTKNSEIYTGEDKDIYYWDLVGAYVEFIYNNKTTYNDDGTVKEYGFITVDPFVGTDAKVNSKAQEYTVTTEKLNDNNLTGTEGANPGRAVTNKDAIITDTNELLTKNKEISEKIKNNTATEADLKDIPLACYYDDTTYKVSNINLGLLEQYDPDYSVNETLAYIKVRMKGYTYTYKYGDAAVTTSTNVPTVNEQNSAVSFTGKIYPTDIAYDVANNSDELQVYVVYSISVKNLETMYVDNVYSEQRLYLDELVNKYDTDRYELCNNENNSDKSDFALWSSTQEGIASYDVNNANSVYKNGMGKQEEKTSYIQFKIKPEALKKILEKSLTAEDIENAPTVATAVGYHEYLRTDNAWIHDENVKAYEGVRGLNIYPATSESGKKYYVHKSISKNRSSADLYLKLSLGDPRKISGTVFEDTKTEESKANNTNIGNGIMDSSEENRAQDVIVELLDADKKAVSKLYKEKDGKVVYNEDGTLPDARVTTQVGGTYEFEGVVPGYYYIRFTYGDGTQKLMPAGTMIKSNDYKSTIINTEENGAGNIIKDALEAKAEDISNAQNTLPANYTETQKKLVEWYKYLNDTNYSTAVDDLDKRLLAEKYQYKDDGKVYDENGNEVTDYPTNIDAYTPMVGISIENDVNDSTDEGDKHKSNYEGFNFGIIEQSDNTTTLDKKITNIKLTTQTGATIVSANPTDKTAKYVSALDNITGGSKYAKVEMDQDMIYGSELETTYEIVIENKSAKDYIEDVDSEEFGHYYKYGEISSTARLKKITVNEVVDNLDDKYDFSSEEERVASTVEHSDGSTEEKEVTITKINEDGSTETSSSLSIKGWSSLENEEKETISYKVTSLLSKDSSTAFENKARITSISVEKLSTIKSNFNWEKAKDSTIVTITPPTGEDRSSTYWVAGTIGLIVLAAGIIFIKKKLLKK